MNQFFFFKEMLKYFHGIYMNIIFGMTADAFVRKPT